MLGDLPVRGIEALLQAHLPPRSALPCSSLAPNAIQMHLGPWLASLGNGQTRFSVPARGLGPAGC